MPLEAGEPTRVAFTLHAECTTFTGLAGRRIMEPGKFTALVGTSSDDLPLQTDFQLTGKVHEAGEETSWLRPAAIA